MFDGGDVTLYRYVRNNPINFVDPTGLVTRCELDCISRGQYICFAVGVSFTALGAWTLTPAGGVLLGRIGALVCVMTIDNIRELK